MPRPLQAICGILSNLQVDAAIFFGGFLRELVTFPRLNRGTVISSRELPGRERKINLYEKSQLGRDPSLLATSEDFQLDCQL